MRRATLPATCSASTWGCSGRPVAARQTTAASFAAEYFDGVQARGRPVRLWLDGDDLCIEGDGVEQRLPQRSVRWPECQRHGPRQAYLPGGGVLHSADGPGWDTWSRAAGRRVSLVERWTQSWRWTLAALLAAVLVLAAGWRWGLPLAADGVAGLLPQAIERQLGEATLAQLDRHLLHPSKLPEQRAQALRAQLAGALKRMPGGPAAVPWRLDLRDGGEVGGHGVGANALALPGGQLIVTDAMVTLLADRPDVLLGVLGHEWGHLRQRHATRMLARDLLLAGAATVLVGDSSSLMALAPSLLARSAYSRDFELAADDDAARLLRAQGIAPQVMAELFARVRPPGPAGRRPDDAAGLAIAFSSHPPDAERVARMAAPR